MLTITAAGLALLSFGLNIWQWLTAWRFPLHRRIDDSAFAPAVTVLKPLKGCDRETEGCLRSWLEQGYNGELQILFGVASAEDPVCELVRRLLADCPKVRAELVICSQQLGTNAKVSTLVQLQARAAHPFIVISDADVRAPAGLLPNLLAPLQDPSVGLVNCFYSLPNPASAAMQWEAVAVDADFWSQVLQSQNLQPLDFALGAVMATSRSQLDKIGGFSVLLDYLADDYQLGHRIAGQGARIVLCPVVVECRSEPAGWRQVWTHQLRWARTIRVCRPVPFFFSILSNATFWPLVWLALARTPLVLAFASGLIFLRIVCARSLQRRLSRARPPWRRAWIVPVKDLLAVAIWALAFAGNHVEWRGNRYRVLKDGRLSAKLRARSAW